jgi:hypothetical protein
MMERVASESLKSKERTKERTKQRERKKKKKNNKNYQGPIMDTLITPTSPEERKTFLSGILESYGLTYDSKNESCRQYVYLGSEALYNQPMEIMEILAQNRFLHEYCDYERGLFLAQRQYENIRLPRDQWVYHVRRCVLQCAGYKKFPDEWPWIQQGKNTSTAKETAV